MKQFLWIAKALADESRLRMLLLLNEGELCVCQIIAVIGLAPSTISKHIAILKQADLVESRKNGRWVYYRLHRESSEALVRDALAFALDSLADSPRVAQDRASLEEVLRVAPDELCSLQTRYQIANPFACNKDGHRQGTKELA